MATPRILLLDYLKGLDKEPLYTELPPAYPDPLSTKHLFQIHLSVFDGEYQVTSTGHNKREAKEEAAKKMLIQLAKDKPDVKNLMESHNFDSMMERSYVEKTDKHVLEKLNAICLINNMSVHFRLMQESGEAHNKLYTIRCEAHNLKVEATRKSMKGAKIACAKKMMELIESQKDFKLEIPKDFKVSYDNIDEVQGDIDQLRSILKSKAISSICSSGVKLSKLHLLETDPDCNVINVLNAVKREKRLDHDMFCRYLDTASLPDIKAIIDRLGREANMNFIVKVEELPAINKLRPITTFLVFVRFYNRDVSKSFPSVGYNKFECEKKSYAILLKYLSDLNLNTSGRSAMLDNTSSDEE